MLVAHLFFGVVGTVTYKSKLEVLQKKWLYQVGLLNKYNSGFKDPRSYPANLHKNYLRYSNLNQKSKNKKSKSFMLNWWSRDQNFRKYFEMRKKNGLRPAETGFYHDKIREEFVESQQYVQRRKEALKYQ